MKLTDFDFDLPDALIATRPARPRTHARLLLAEGDRITDKHVYDLIDIFRPGDRLVLNNTKVIPARLTGHRQRGEARAKIEVTLLEPQAEGWRALAKPLRKVEVGEVITFSADLSATVLEKSETDMRIGFNLSGDDFDAALAQAGDQRFAQPALGVGIDRVVDGLVRDALGGVFRMHALESSSDLLRRQRPAQLVAHPSAQGRVQQRPELALAGPGRRAPALRQLLGRRRHVGLARHLVAPELSADRRLRSAQLPGDLAGDDVLAVQQADLRALVHTQG